MRHRIIHYGLLAILCGAAANVQAADVALVGIFPGKAVLSIDGGAPHTLSAGQSLNGVKLISVDNGGAVIEVAGKQDHITLGAQSYAVGDSGDSGGAQSITLVANPQGHFVTQGSINGSMVTFMVDTGATYVSMGPSQARQAGINYSAGEHGWSNTANGVVPIWFVKLSKVTVNGLTLTDIDGVVMPVEMPAVLLGMSFLGRMSMNRDGSTMVLKRRF